MRSCGNLATTLRRRSIKLHYEKEYEEILNSLKVTLRVLVQSNPIKNFDFPKQSPSKGFST